MHVWVHKSYITLLGNAVLFCGYIPWFAIWPHIERENQTVPKWECVWEYMYVCVCVWESVLNIFIYRKWYTRIAYQFQWWARCTYFATESIWGFDLVYLVVVCLCSGRTFMYSYKLFISREYIYIYIYVSAHVLVKFTVKNPLHACMRTLPLLFFFCFFYFTLIFGL